MFGAEQSIFFDQTFLLTAATEGLGPEIARCLVARGAVVLGTDRNADALAALQRTLGDTFVPLARDLADPAAPVEIARWIAEDYPRLAGLICNAAGPADLTAAGSDAPSRQIFGPVALTGLLWPALCDPGRTVFALLLPPGTLSGSFAQMASALQHRAWNAGQRSGVTTVSVAAGLLTSSPAEQNKAAQRILAAIDNGRPHLRLGNPWRPAASVRRPRLDICHAGGSGRS
jgi:NAD(P)-dependent dehydrogenase (short-subunit alcohol dehydrogenase family)